jgi:hypothetical protein
VADRDRAHGAGVAAVDARLAVQDLRTHDLGFHVEQDIADFGRIGLDALRGQACHDFGRQRLEFLLARRLLAGLVGVADFRVGQLRHLGDQRFVLRCRRPLPSRLAAFFDHRVDGVDDGLHLGVAEHDRAQHDFFGQLLRFRLDHQHGVLGAGDDQVHLRGLELGGGRVQDVLAVGVADARGADRAAERDAGHAQGGRGADHRRDVRIDFRVHRQHVDDDLDFVEVAFREQRADRAVDQARGQRFFFGRTAFALEEAAGDLTSRVGFLDVVDGQREEVLARLGVFPGNDGCQYHGVFYRHQHGAGCLAGDLAGFQRDRVLAILEGLRNFIKHG